MKLKTEKQQKEINEIKIWIFKKINEIGNTLPRLTKKKREETN